jgi:hypothetical protein
MKKILALIICLLIFAPPLQLEAAILGGELRVGLTSRYYNLASITFHNNVLDIGYESGGHFVFEARINISTTLVASTDHAYYFSVGSFTNFTEARQEAIRLTNNGFRAVPASVGIGQWTVYVGGYASAADAAMLAITAEDTASGAA